MNRDEVVAKAAEAMCSCGLAPPFTKSGPCPICRGRAIKLDSAGLLATPEMRECAEACAELADGASRMAFGLINSDRIIAAGLAYAASVRKPERYCVDIGTQRSWVRNSSGVVVAEFHITNHERHAREWAAKLNAEDRP